MEKKKSYLLAFSESLGSQEKIKSCLDKLSEVDSWRFDMPYAFYIISDKSASTIASAITSELGNGRFLITEITSNKQGRLPRAAWTFINDKKLE